MTINQQRHKQNNERQPQARRNTFEEASYTAIKKKNEETAPKEYKATREYREAPLQDHGYGQSGRGTKRGIERLDEHGMDERRKRGARTKTLFIGDSLIKCMVEDRELNKVAFERQWDIRMKRGGYMKEIEEMWCDADLHEYKWAVICGGSNDLTEAEYCRDDRDRREKIKRIVAGYKRMVDEAKDHCKVILITPPPRRDVSKDIRTELADRMKALRSENVRTLGLVEGETEEEFLMNMRRDGVHLDNDQFIRALKKLLVVMGEDTCLNALDDTHMIEEMARSVLGVWGTAQ